jgi:hypothetical protein
MGITELSNMKTNDIFSRDRFMQIFWMLHLYPTPPSTGPQTRTKQIQHFLQYLEKKKDLLLFLVKQYLLMRECQLEG